MLVDDYFAEMGIIWFITFPRILEKYLHSCYNRKQ